MNDKQKWALMKWGTVAFLLAVGTALMCFTSYGLIAMYIAFAAGCLAASHWKPHACSNERSKP